jgi:hypothetical protein
MVQRRTASGALASALRKVTYVGNDPHDYQLVARHSGTCVDFQWTCEPTGQADQLNQTRRLLGR